jgi:hypothetical protein
LIDASLLGSKYERQAEQKAENYRSSARIRAEARCAALPRAEIRPCVYQEFYTARQSEHDEYDLQAQLVTSVWTRVMGIAAIVGMAVGILGVGLIYKTFEETRRTAYAAHEANRAFKDVERPRLVPNPGGADITDGAQFTLQFPVTNVGRASAHIIGLALAHLGSNTYHEDLVAEPMVRVVHAGDSGTIWVFTFDYDDAFPYLGGFVVYRSSFGEHRSYFCYRLEPDPDVPMLWLHPDKGDDWPKDT